MIKADLVALWPRNNDYPLWREYVRDNRTRFNNIIIVFTETHQGPDYREFVRHAMFPDFVQFVDSREVKAGEDWRNVAVNQGLFHSLHSEWVLFTEQDFFPHYTFWDEINPLEFGSDVIAAFDGPRMHPCFILLRRTYLSKTSRNFGIVPDVSDHFGIFQKELFASGARITAIPPHLYNHYNGLSHNFTLISSGQLPNYRKEEFDRYLVMCLSVQNVPLDASWANLVQGYLLES